MKEIARWGAVCGSAKGKAGTWGGENWRPGPKRNVQRTRCLLGAKNKEGMTALSSNV